VNYTPTEFEQARQRLGLTLEAFATLLGITRMGLNNVLSGRKQPSRTLLSLARLLRDLPDAAPLLERLRAADPPPKKSTRGRKPG
jgi:DNA-binding transcriptional regulator YiaG